MPTFTAEQTAARESERRQRRELAPIAASTRQKYLVTFTGGGRSARRRYMRLLRAGKLGR